jgi:hypothetical protein
VTKPRQAPLGGVFDQPAGRTRHQKGGRFGSPGAAYVHVCAINDTELSGMTSSADHRSRQERVSPHLQSNTLRLRNTSRHLYLVRNFEMI